MRRWKRGRPLPHGPGLPAVVMKPAGASATSRSASPSGLVIAAGRASRPSCSATPARRPWPMRPPHHRPPLPQPTTAPLLVLPMLLHYRRRSHRRLWRRARPALPRDFQVRPKQEFAEWRVPCLAALALSHCPEARKGGALFFSFPAPGFSTFFLLYWSYSPYILRERKKMRKGKEKRNAPWGPEDKRAGPGERGQLIPISFIQLPAPDPDPGVSGFSPHCSLPHHSGTAVPLCILRGRAALQGPPPASYLWRLAGLVVPQRAIRE